MSKRKKSFEYDHIYVLNYFSYKKENKMTFINKQKRVY